MPSGERWAAAIGGEAMQIQYTVDENHLIRGFAYHDGTLTGVLDEGEDKVLIIRNAQSETLWIRFVGATQFLLTNFLDGNILSEIFLWRMSDKDFPRHLFAQFLEGAGFANIDHLENRIALRKTGWFVKVQCSYGAEVGVVCADVVVERKAV